MALPTNNTEVCASGTSFNMEFKKLNFLLKKIQISTVQCCLKLQNMIYCIVNLKKHD